MGSILDIDSSLNINNRDFERYYSIGNIFKLSSIRNFEYINKLPVTRPFHDTWLDMIFDVKRICSKSDDFNFDIFGDKLIYGDLRYGLGIRSTEIGPIHKFVLAALLNTIYENNSVIYKLNECKSKDYALDKECGFFIEGAIIDMDLDEVIMNFQKNKRGEKFSRVVKILFSANLDKDVRMMTIQVPYMFDNGNYVHEGTLEFYFNRRSMPLFNI